MNDYVVNPEETREYLPRFKFIYFLLFVVFGLFAFRLWYLQILQGSELREFSERNRLQENHSPAPRGMIFDRQGRVLVDNVPGFVATLTPQYATQLEKTAGALGVVLNLPPAGIVQKVRQSRHRNGLYFPVRIKENLSRDEVARLELMKLDHPGLEIQMVINRNYHLSLNGSQMFGYVGEVSRDELSRLNRSRPPEEKLNQGDLIGKSGLEQVLDKILRGQDGVEFVQVDAHGREMSSANLEILGGLSRTQEYEPGQNLHLTIDKDVQEAAFKALNETGRIGSAVALDPNTGEILAWVNSPSFDPNQFAGGISSKLWSDLVNDPFKPMRNRVIQNHQPPGSTFKAITALAGLQEGVIDTRTRVTCRGFLQFGRRPYHCHLKGGHGDVNVVEALEQSCDIFFYKLGIQLGIDRIAKYARMLGLGSRTGIELIGEVPGLVPTTEWKKRAIGEEWQPGENLSNAIGQGFMLVTPLQMAVAYGALGIDGPTYKPFIIKKITDTEEKVIQNNDPVLVRDSLQDVKRENFEIVKEGLRRVSNSPRGTAVRHRIPGVEMAGKTGTVQLMSISAEQIYAKCENKPIRQRHHGWFVGYAPADKPVISVAVLAEHACSGSGGAAPVVKEIIKAYLQKYHPEKIKAERVAPAVATAPAGSSPEVEE